MIIEIFVSEPDRLLVNQLLRGDYRGWNERELCRTFAEIGLHCSLVDHVRWQGDIESREAGGTRPD